MGGTQEQKLTLTGSCGHILCLHGLSAGLGSHGAGGDFTHHQQGQHLNSGSRTPGTEHFTTRLHESASHATGHAPVSPRLFLPRATVPITLSVLGRRSGEPPSLFSVGHFIFVKGLCNLAWSLRVSGETWTFLKSPHLLGDWSRCCCLWASCPLKWRLPFMWLRSLSILIWRSWDPPFIPLKF